MGAVLVTGFGAFGGVADNPSGRVARAVDGRLVEGRRVTGLELPVSYARGPALAIAAARALGAELVVGLGVAAWREVVAVERVAVRGGDDRPDVDGALAALHGPDRVEATLDTARLAEALGAELSDDAGRYVCNAWLYAVAAALPVPVGFVHVPPSGLDPERLIAAISLLLRRS